MSQVKDDDESYEDRLVILEELGIEENTLEHDESTDEVSASTTRRRLKSSLPERSGNGPKEMLKEQPKKSLTL